MNNAELIKALRNCADASGTCAICKYSKNIKCKWEMLHDAADALEAAEKRIVELNTKCADLQSQINSMENEIEELMPKDGEWIWDGDTGTYHCSECNATSPREDQDGEYIDCPNYCPNCGARMRGEHDEQ